MADLAASGRDAVEYPERHWVAQSVFHGDAVELAKAALRHHFRERDDVLVAMELTVYYKRGDKKAWLRPDVQVVFGVGRGNRSVFKAWEEGKAPDFVLEVASPSTADRDAHFKAEEFARIGVKEYWRLDPEGTIMAAPLEGYRAMGGRYRGVQRVKLTDGIEYLPSRVLGLELRPGTRNGATVLVFRDPLTGKEFRSAEDAEANRAQALEDKLAVARHEARAARDELALEKQRNRLLEQQLRKLRARDRPMG